MTHGKMDDAQGESKRIASGISFRKDAPETGRSEGSNPRQGGAGENPAKRPAALGIDTLLGSATLAQAFQHEPNDSPLYQCKECEGYFNEENAEGITRTNARIAKSGGARLRGYSCAECDQGPMQEVQAFFCPIDARCLRPAGR